MNKNSFKTKHFQTIRRKLKQSHSKVKLNLKQKLKTKK